MPQARASSTRLSSRCPPLAHESRTSARRRERRTKQCRTKAPPERGLLMREGPGPDSRRLDGSWDAPLLVAPSVAAPIPEPTGCCVGAGVRARVRRGSRLRHCAGQGIRHLPTSFEGRRRTASTTDGLVAFTCDHDHRSGPSTTRTRAVADQPTRSRSAGRRRCDRRLSGPGRSGDRSAIGLTATSTIRGIDVCIELRQADRGLAVRGARSIDERRDRALRARGQRGHRSAGRSSSGRLSAGRPRDVAVLRAVRALRRTAGRLRLALVVPSCLRHPGSRRA